MRMDDPMQDAGGIFPPVLPTVSAEQQDAEPSAWLHTPKGLQWGRCLDLVGSAPCPQPL